MTCKICGTEIPENETRCPKCGASIETEPAAQTAAVVENPRGFSNKRNILIIAIALVLLIIGGAVTAVAVTRGGTQSTESIMTLAERYLKEENYEQAVIEFQRVIELDPMNVDAYLNLAKAYIGLGEKEKALEVLREGLEATGDSRLQDMIDELTKPAESSNSSSTVQTSSSTSQDTTPVEQLADEPKATREYDGENRLVWERVTSPDGIITDTNYGEYLDEGYNVIGWGVTGKATERIDENGDIITISNYSYNNNGTLSSEEQYNERGDLIIRKNYEGETATSTYTYKYEYGPFGVISKVETVVETYGETYTSVYTTKYTYNADGKLISETETRDDGSLYRYTENKYNADGKRIDRHVQTYERDGSLIGDNTGTWKYNDAGRRIEHYQYNRAKPDSEGHWRNEQTTIEKANDDGRLIERIQRKISNGRESESIDTYSYDDNGKDIERKFIDKDPSGTVIRTQTYTHNENGYEVHIATTSTFTDGSEPKNSESVITYVFEYDELGRNILETAYDEDGNIVGKTEYEY